MYKATLCCKRGRLLLVRRRQRAFAERFSIFVHYAKQGTLTLEIKAYS
jgi:hypothetical protein